MARPIRGLHLSRRTFLRGTGVAIGLPWLDAMVPALRSAPPRPVRCLFVFAPNGKCMADWTPERTGREFDLPFLLEPLEPFRRDLLLFTGLALDGGRAHGDGPGDHARAAASFLTCAHPRKTGGADLEAGISIDQVIADALGAATPFPSLEVGMEGGRLAGVCDSGYSCAYSNNIAWRTPSTPLTKEVDPRAVFTRLFGDPDERPSRAERARERTRLRSVLDAAIADVRRVRRELSAADRAKLDEYLDSVREVETRLEKQESAPEAAVEVPEALRDAGHGDGFAGDLRLMYDLLALAFRSDRTRVATFMLGNAGSNRSYRFLDVPDGHHDLSHHRGDAAKIAGIRRINRFHVEAFADFLTTLASTDDGGAPLLRNSMVLYGSGLSDGNRHDHADLPILLAGGGGGRLAPGRHIAFDRETPLADLYLTMLAVLGVEREAFADSTGTLPVLA